MIRLLRRPIHLTRAKPKYINFTITNNKYGMLNRTAQSKINLLRLYLYVMLFFFLITWISNFVIISRNMNLKKDLDQVNEINSGLMNQVIDVETALESARNEIKELKQEVEIFKKPVFRGKVSYYSKDGCLGCSANQVMANGKIFNENALTLAFNRLPLNTKVRVTNLSNGKSTVAIVTDTGGFERHGRIADLSKGLYEVLNASTDKSLIEIAKI